MLNLIGSSPNSKRLVPVFRREPDCFLSRFIGNVLQFVVDMRLIYPLGTFRKAISHEDGFDQERVVPTSG
jgi:hypothetical protein